MKFKYHVSKLVFQYHKKDIFQFRYKDCYIFSTSDFNSPVNHSAHIKAACWLMLEFYLYFWLQDNQVQKFYLYIQRLMLLTTIIAIVWKPTIHYMHWRFSKSSKFCEFPRGVEYKLAELPGVKAYFLWNFQLKIGVCTKKYILTRMWEGNFCKIHDEKLETLESFKAKMVYFFTKFSGA